MLKPILRLFAGLILLLLGLGTARASDHADPMSLNAFALQKEPAANITDLHAFIVDAEGKLITTGDPSATGDALILSLCVRRALQPQQIAMLDLQGFKFRVHLDTRPPVRFFDERLTREGADYAQALAGRTQAVEERTAALESARKQGDKAKEAVSDREWKAALTNRAMLVEQHETDRSMQALYGGIITEVESVAAAGILEFELGLVRDGEASEATIRRVRTQGISGRVNIVTNEKAVDGKVVIPSHAFRRRAINVQAGVFDDPFIFPRFFRRNVVGIVVSIPLTSVPMPARHGPILLWATTHDSSGRQIDHVGRSLRTQLPRFGYLNERHPADHVKAITRIHDRPTIMEDIAATFIAPLIAHRHYDSAPDVMVYDLTKPARFPNGRALHDDVGRILADAGETLLLELSHAESKQFPRATTNDKEFQPKFPYLASRWTSRDIAANANAGTMIGTFAVPRAGDPSAIAAADFKPHTWRTLWLASVAALLILTVLLLLTLRSTRARLVFLSLALIGFGMLQAVREPIRPPSDPKAMAQPGERLNRLLLGGGFIALFGTSWVFALGRRSGSHYREPEPFPPGNQEVTDEDQPIATDSYDTIKHAVFAQPYYGSAWGGPERQLLPVYKQSLGSILRRSGPFAARLLLQAAKRTVRSRADLRWGKDRKGFRRLLHPMGICLTGTWRITGSPGGKSYTGYFAQGCEGRIIARYSNGGSVPHGGHYRSLALIGKIYLPGSTGEIPKEGPAHFFTQEDLGANFTNSIREAVLTNSPPVSPWNRGKDFLFLLINAMTLFRGDAKITERQLYEIAELGKPRDVPTSCPRFMRLTVAEETPVIGGQGADFRDEILSIIYDRANPAPQRKLVFDIAVSDSGKKVGFGVEFLTGQEWTTIGQIIFDDAAASYNGDFVIHFHHPAWRKDMNNPDSIQRPDLR